MNLNDSGEVLLDIVSNGNSIIAEILRLKDYIPSFIRLESKADQLKYKEIVLDFSYFKNQDVQDKKIENDPVIQELDEDVRENYLDLLTRFYYAFESICRFATDLNHFISELSDGYYIQQTLETMFQDNEGKQLLCESLHLFGIMLLVTDFYIPSILRERLLILYYRYSSAKAQEGSNIDDVCTLLRSTGFSAQTGKTIQDYPANYFNRFKFDENYIDMVISRLKSDDIYNQISLYPLSEHRPTALAGQASMLFICLYFSPNILHKQISQMREIVDKFFSESFVTSIYMGITVNLLDAWEYFNAAKSAIYSVVESSNLKQICLKHRDNIFVNVKRTEGLLQDGILSESFVLQHITKILTVLRNCNVNLRWILLHANLPILSFGNLKKVKQVTEQTVSDLDLKKVFVFNLLLNTSEVEVSVKDVLKDIISHREEKWTENRKEAFDRVIELSEVFSGVRQLSKIEVNPKLQAWFVEIGKEIEKLSTDDAVLSGKKVVQLVQALDEVQQFHNLQSNMQVKQYLQETRQYLHTLIQILNIKEDILIDIQMISDLSYAWNLINLFYTSQMQESIKKNPKIVTKLRSAFLKLSSALEIPLLRINQSKSEDLESVSKYYSNELASYIRKVIQIIPETMFTILEEIIRLQTNVLLEIPTRLEKSKLREYAQFDERFKVSKLTYEISLYTEGILMMKKTLVGVIELDPKKMLEDGIRKELVKHLSNAMHNEINFTTTKNKSISVDMEEKLDSLETVVNGYRKSFEYIQDYLNVQGLKCIQEELSRIIGINVERECNRFVRTKVHDWQSKYQNSTIAIPIIPSSDKNSENFIGRLANRLVDVTDPKTTVYLDLKSTWYDRKTKKELITGKIFSKVHGGFGPVGLVGLDKLFAFMFISDLEKNIGKMQNNIANDKMWTDAFLTLEKDFQSNNFQGNPMKTMQSYTVRWVKVWPMLLEWIMGVGHKQILRENLCYELNRNCKFNSKHLESSLETFNSALLHEIRKSELPEKSKEVINNKLITYLNEYLQFSGQYDPLSQIFIVTKNSKFVPLFFFLFTVFHCSKLQFNENLNSLVAKSPKDLIDGHPVILGLMTILNQFQPLLTEMYVKYLGQYATSCLQFCLSNKTELTEEVQTVIHFIKIFVRTAKTRYEVPELLFSSLSI